MSLAERPFAFRKPAKMPWFGPGWIAIVLPLRSAGVLIGVCSAIDRMQNGFFWYVLGRISSGEPLSVMCRAVESGADRPTSTLPVATAWSMSVVPPTFATRFTDENPAAL